MDAIGMLHAMTPPRGGPRSPGGAPLSIFGSRRASGASFTAFEGLALSTITADRPAPAGDIEWLRHPSERPALLACVAANLTVIVIALTVVFASSVWLADHPVSNMLVHTFRAIAIAVIVAFPATALGRHVHLYETRGNAIRVTATQFPQLHEALLHACEKLGVAKVPELYIGRVSHDAVMEVHSIWHHQHCIVLNSDWLVDKHWTPGTDWMSFIIARGVAAIRLGHTDWWMELLTVYVKHIPGLRTPLLVAWIYSRDRCAAWAVPDGIRGLVIEATGKDMIWSVDIAEALKQPLPNGVWAWAAALARKSPHLFERARALYDAGLFDMERDLARCEGWKQRREDAVAAFTSVSGE